MRDYEYEVVFKGGDIVYVTCGSHEHATILARAKRIQAGLDDTVTAVRQITG